MDLRVPVFLVSLLVACGDSPAQRAEKQMARESACIAAVIADSIKTSLSAAETTRDSLHAAWQSARAAVGPFENNDAYYDRQLAASVIYARLARARDAVDRHRQRRVYADSRAVTAAYSDSALNHAANAADSARYALVASGRMAGVGGNPWYDDVAARHRAAGVCRDS